MKSKKRIIEEHLFEGIDPEGFEEYRDFMYDNYNVLMENKIFFIKDKWFSPDFKCERIQELLDFFLLEEEHDRCKKLESIKQALEIQQFLDETLSH
jgi:hypothetical protein